MRNFCLNVAGIQPMSGASIRLQMAGDGLEVRLPTNEAAHRLRTIRELMPRVHQKPSRSGLYRLALCRPDGSRQKESKIGMNWSEEHSTIIAGLDLGTTKVCAVIAEQVAERPLRIIGIGEHPSEGLQRGAIVDAEKTVRAIGEAVRQAELMAGVEIDSVYAGISGEYIASINSTGMVAVGGEGGWIGAQDRARVLAAARRGQSAVRPRSTARFAPRICRQWPAGHSRIPWVCMECA